jgi:ADP-heptose:LPS heptosyltransferase
MAVVHCTCGGTSGGRPDAAGRTCAHCLARHQPKASRADPGRYDWPPGPSAAHLAALRLYAEAAFDPPAGLAGRGLVTAGEGAYWPGVEVLVKTLREVGCALPVLAFYRSTAGAARPHRLAGLGCECVDLDATDYQPPGVPPDRPQWAGWAAKLEMMRRAPWRDVLWLDSDAWPAADPSFLLDLAADHGLAAWTDPHPSADVLNWAEVWPDAVAPGARPVPRPLSSGQFAFRKDAVWKEFLIARWVCSRAGYYFPRMLGDQDAWRAALAITGRAFHDLGDFWRHPDARHVYVYQYRGRDVIVHTSEPKLVSLGLPLEHRARQHFADALRPDPFADAGPDTIVVNHGAGGVGDAVQGAGAVAALKREHPDKKVVYRVSDWGLPFARLFAGPDEYRPFEYDEDARRVLRGPDRQLNTDYRVEERRRGPEPRLARYARNIGATPPPVWALRDPAECDRQSADFATSPPFICILPFSRGSDREYPVQGWKTVAPLLAEKGYRVVFLAADDRARLLADFECVTGASAERAAGVLRRAAAAVGIDSGMTHVACALGVPTLALMGPTTGECVFAGYGPHVSWLAGPFSCTGCWWQPPSWLGERCKPQCPAVGAIEPRTVARHVDEIALARGLAGGRSLIGADRLAVIRDEARRAARLPEGDFAELGVFRGGSARLIARFAGGRPLHLFDTWEGMPEDDAAPGGHAKGNFAADEAEARATVAHPAAVFHRGVFPATAPPGGRYAFVHVDGDIEQTTKAAVAYFAPRMVPGGVIVWDDCGLPGCPGVEPTLRAAFGPRVEARAPNQAVVRF